MYDFSKRQRLSHQGKISNVILIMRCDCFKRIKKIKCYDCFICVIVLDKMCFHMLNFCWFKHKNIFECFRFFWKLFFFYKKKKKNENFKNGVALFWRLIRGSSKSHAIAASSRVGFGDLFTNERSNREGYIEIFAAQLATPSWVDLPIAKNA